MTHFQIGEQYWVETKNAFCSGTVKEASTRAITIRMEDNNDCHIRIDDIVRSGKKIPGNKPRVADLLCILQSMHWSQINITNNRGTYVLEAIFEEEVSKK